MKNKILIASFCLFLLSTGFANGQKADSYEFTAGTGIGSSDELFDGYSPGFLLGVSLKDYIVNQYSGAYFFSFKYFLGKKISLDIAFSYENESGGWQKNINVGTADEWEAISLGSFKRQAFTWAPEIQVTYINKGMARVYTTAGIGITYVNEVDKYDDTYYQSQYYNGVNSLGNIKVIANNKTHPNGYISPIGVSIGSAVRWFGEVGIGYKGIVNTGISIKL